MVVQRESVLHGRRINAGAQSGIVDQTSAMLNAQTIRVGRNFVRSLSAGFPFPSGDEDSQVISQFTGSLAQRSAGDRGHSGTVPVKTQHAAKRLKPPRITQTSQHFGRPEFIDDRHRDGTAKLRHPPKQPGGRFAAVQRHLCNSTLRHPAPATRKI